MNIHKCTFLKTEITTLQRGKEKGPCENVQVMGSPQLVSQQHYVVLQMRAACAQPQHAASMSCDEQHLMKQVPRQFNKDFGIEK